MAQSMAVVTRMEIGSKLLGGGSGRGGRQPKTASYRNEKQKIETKANAPATSALEVKVKPLSLLRTHLGMKKEKKIMWVVVAMVEATEGHEPHEALEVAEAGKGVEVDVAPPTTNEENKQENPYVPLPNGPIDRSLLLSFKHHIAAAIWDNVIEDASLVNCALSFLLESYCCALSVI
ncbi:hypothetical protein Syun_011690 [Stephania yunnanensis]|uniref:Uncharacterized protein n=1 Tax=Stephania yunnanensis TaxID=152371 RepID=A0AAP0K087_9MAGN